MQNVLHVEIDVQECDLECWINDIPVWRVKHRLATHHAMPVHEYLVKGTNTLRLVRVDLPPAAPAGAATDAAAVPAASGRARIAAYAPGAALGQRGGHEICAVDYRASPGAASPSVEASFALDAWPFAWSWQALPPMNWRDPAVHAAVFRWLQEFAARFHAGDAAWVANVLQPKMSEYCRAYGFDPGAELRELAARMARRAADASFTMTPLSPPELVLLPCAGGRLADCQLANGDPAIRWKDQRVGSRGAMRLKVGRANQQLLVFR